MGVCVCVCVCMPMHEYVLECVCVPARIIGWGKCASLCVCVCVCVFSFWEIADSVKNLPQGVWGWVGGWVPACGSPKGGGWSAVFLL